VDGTGSGSFPKEGFDNSGIKSLDSTTTMLYKYGFVCFLSLYLAELTVG
jgi:hypothetical protein